MLYLKIAFKVFPDKRKEFEQAVPWLVHTDEAIEEKIKQQMLHDSGNSEDFVYLGEWETREELELHLQTERFRALWGGMKLLGKITEAKILNSDRIEDLNLPR